MKPKEWIYIDNRYAGSWLTRRQASVRGPLAVLIAIALACVWVFLP